ncbi:membrane protein [Marivirga tractuosa]|uniref:Aerotolerance regulator N-terminal domain-containing protein n=2 Tax=Marivirga TaxID=869806 RepID=E4TTI4_MARTH|nr:conserved hypothetical protein [Marivirga tractuosa DSM 4126]BDD16339.1 membrane protein [Marivirga tractuosa]
MNITNPNAFWLLFLIIIPILIHLFQFRKYKSLKFSNLFFLSEVNEEQKRSRKLKHILILISRILLILFLVLSIAKPFWKSEAMNSEVNLLVLDQSASNTAYAEGSSSPIIEENMSYINQLFESYPQSLKAVNQSGNSLEAYQEIEIAENEVTLNLERIIKENQSSEKLLLLSDFQKSVIDNNTSTFSDSSKGFVLMPPYQQKPNNIWVDSLWVVQMDDGSGNEELKVQISSLGESGDINIALENDEQLIGTQQLFLENKGKKTVSFPIKRFSSDMSSSFRIQLEAGDLDFDNTFYFSLPERSKLKILLLAESKSNTLLSTVFENDELFTFRSESLNNFAFQDLDEYDLVIVELGNQLNNFASGALKTYAAKGNNLVVIPKTNFDQYIFLEDLGFSNVSNISRQDKTPVRLQSPDLQNPFFRNVFNNMNEAISMPEAALYLKWNSGQKILSFINGYPFLGLTGINENIFLFASPFDQSYTNFTQHGIFLPVFYKIAFSGKKENQTQYFFLNQDVIELSKSDIPEGTVVKLQQGEQELVPDQRISGNEMRLILPQEDIKSGFYSIINTKTEEKLGVLALNIPKKESETGYYTTAELQSLFQDQENVVILDGYDFSSIKDYIDETKNGFPLWKYFLVLALLSLLAEVLIIRLLK